MRVALQENFIDRKLNFMERPPPPPILRASKNYKEINKKFKIDLSNN